MRALGGESGQEVSETERRVDGAHLLLGRAGWQSHGSSRGCGGREDGALGSGRCQGARAGVWIAPHAALGPHTCSPRSPGGLGYPLVASSSSTSSVEGSPRRGMAPGGGACIPGVRADVPASLYPRMAAPAGKEVTSVSWPAAGRQLRDGPGPHRDPQLFMGGPTPCQPCQLREGAASLAWNPQPLAARPPQGPAGPPFLKVGLPNRRPWSGVAEQAGTATASGPQLGPTLLVTACRGSRRLGPRAGPGAGHRTGPNTFWLMSASFGP